MPERILVYDPLRVKEREAVARAVALACPTISRGLAPWMADRGDILYSTDGYVAVVLPSNPRGNAQRTVLAILRDRNLTLVNLDAVREPDPTPEPPTMADAVRAVDTSRIVDVATRQALDDLKAALTGGLR